MPLKKRKASKAPDEEAALPPPPDAQAKPTPQAPLPSHQELVFHTQLAHGSPTRKIRDFSNVRELYQRIGEVFSVPTTDVSATVRSSSIKLTIVWGLRHVFVCDPHCISCSDGLVWISTSVVGVCLKAGHIFQSNAGAGTACARARVL